MEPAPHGDASAQWWPKRWRRRTGLAGRAGLGGVHRSWSWEPHARAAGSKRQSEKKYKFRQKFPCPLGEGSLVTRNACWELRAQHFFAQS